MSVIKPIVVQAGGPTVIPITNTNLMQPTTIRVISPSQVFATTTVQQPPPPPPPRIITSEESFPTTSSREDSATQLMNDKNGSRTWIEKIHDWLFQKDFLNLYNLIWVLLATAIALAITATAICLTVVYCRQANADVTATTLQAGRFVTEGCSASSQCLDNGQCVGGQCQCVADFYYDDQMGQCLAVKTYGVACTDSRECDSTAYLGCYKPLYESLCLCPYGFFWGNYYGTYECLTYRSIGMVCQSTSDCAATSYCAYTGSDYRCLCQSGYYADSSSGQCTLLKQYNEPCNFYYNECDSNFFCRGVVGAANQQYFCLCRSDYYFNGTSHSCLPTSTYGGWCFNVTHCNPFANLLCLNGACSCSATQYWNGTMCVDYLLYGQPCYNQTLCNPYDANLLCMVPPLGTSQTVCYCRSGYYFDEYVSQCAPVKYPNQNCTDSYECIDYAVCQWNSLYVESKVCMCVPGYFYKTSSSACVPAVGYLSSCVSDTCNSILGLYCNSASVCDCRSDYFYDTTIGFCRLTYVSGDTCTSSTQCRPSRTLTCSAGTCGP